MSWVQCCPSRFRRYEQENSDTKLAVMVLVLVVLVLMLGSICYKKPTIYLYIKNSDTRFITILAPSARFIIILALKALFCSQFWRLSAFFKVPKALFIINFGAEGALYCQSRFVNILCIVL